MPILLKTEAGVSLLPPTYVVPITRDGEIEERYLSELRLGDVLLFRKDAPPTTLAEVTGILYSDVQGYKEARDFCYARCNGHEVTRLRCDLIRTLSRSSPQIFTPEERERPEDLIFRKSGNDFSSETADRITDWLFETLDQNRIQHTRMTYRNWINGETIHPENQQEAVRIAQLLRSPEFEHRALQILNSPPEQNKYRNLVATHRITMSLLSPPKAKGIGISIGTEKEHVQIPKWYMSAVEKLRPRIQENVVEARLLGIELVEEKLGEETERAKTGLTKGVIGYLPELESKLDLLYERLKLDKVKSRKQKLKDDLSARIELLGDVMSFANVFCFEKVASEIKTPTPAIFQYIETHADKFAISTQVAAVGRILHPSYDYSPETQENINAYFFLLDERILKDRKFRRNYLREVENCLPVDNPLYLYYSSVFNRSVLLQSLMMKRAFISRVTYDMRRRDIEDIKDFVKISNRPNFMLKEALDQIQRHINLKERGIKILFEQPIVKDSIEKIRSLDREIPPELISLLSPNSGFPWYDLSDPIAEKIFRAFGLNSSEWGKRGREMILRMEKESHEVLGKFNIASPEQLLEDLTVLFTETFPSRIVEKTSEQLINFSHSVR
jgi:hypothetical protein